MDITRIETVVATQAEAVDAAARTLGNRLPRRRALGLLVATLGSGLFGLAAHREEASAKRRRKKHSHHGHGGNGGGGNGGNGGTQPPQNQPALCLALNNVCGSNPSPLGHCRLPIPADNDANLICTANIAGNPCSSSQQCGAGTRCVFQFPTGYTCRVVIP